MFIFGKKKKRLMELYEDAVNRYEDVKELAKSRLELLIEDCDDETRAMRRKHYDDILATQLEFYRIKCILEYRLRIKKS